MKALKRGDFKIAKDYFEMTLNEARDTENKDKEGIIYNNLGHAHHSLSDFKTAMVFFP